MGTLANPYRDLAQAADRPVVTPAVSKPLVTEPYRAMPTVKQLPRRKPRAVTKVSRGRRVLREYTAENPLEARAISYDVLPQSILERIVYKRNLILFGPPGPFTWDTQVVKQGGVRADFVYWMVYPPVVIETQGQIWHDAFADYGDASRAFFLEAMGFRYFEIFEDDILARDDSWLDDQILSMLGSTNIEYREARLALPRQSLVAGGLLIQVFKEKRFSI